MPNRGAGGVSYRYGFNGKETENDVKGIGNEQDYGMRIYDPRLGRFLSFDPLNKEYNDLSPFHFAGCNPIQNIDQDGGEPRDFMENWQPVAFRVNGGSPVFNRTVRDPQLGYINVEAYYDKWTKQTWFVHSGNDGRYYYWKHTPGADQTIRMAGNGKWEEFRTQNQIQYQNTVRLCKGIAGTVAVMVVAPFAWAGIVESGSAAVNIARGPLAAVGRIAMKGALKGALAYYKMAPTLAALGKAAVDILDESGSIGSQNSHITFESLELLTKYFGHIFQKNHLKSGLLNAFGSSESDAIRNIEAIIKESLTKLKEGDNIIFTSLNGVRGTVKAFVKDNKVISIDAMSELAHVRDPEKVNVIEYIKKDK